MSYTFDGINKLIILSVGVTTVEVKDLYSRWKDWTIQGDNSKYLPAFSVLGGDPLPGGRYLGTTYFLENGWKIRPFEGNHTLVLSGNLYSRDGSDPFTSTLGAYNVRIMLTVSNLVDTIETGGGSGGATDWTSQERAQIRQRLSIDGAQATPVNNAGTLALIESNTNTVLNNTILALSVLDTLLKYQANRTKIDQNLKTLTIFDDDGVTPIRVFDLKNFAGQPSLTEVAERDPQ
jgi:hypothetical protein